MRILVLLALFSAVAAYGPSAAVRPALASSGTSRAPLQQIVCRKYTPEEQANMKKWGKILRTADTFDSDYLKKNKGSSAKGASEPNVGAGILVAGTFGAVVAMALASVGN